MQPSSQTVSSNSSFILVLTSKMSEVKAQWSPFHFSRTFSGFILINEKVLTIFIFHALACSADSMLFFISWHEWKCFVYNGAVAAEKISKSKLKWLAPFHLFKKIGWKFVKVKRGPFSFEFGHFWDKHQLLWRVNI